MKDLFPHFKLLKAVKWQFARHPIRFNLWFFKRLWIALHHSQSLSFAFESDSLAIQIYTQTNDEEFHALELNPKGKVSQNLFIKADEPTYIPYEKDVYVTLDSILDSKSEEPIEEKLFILNGSEYTELQGGLFIKDEKDSYILFKNEYTSPSKWTLIASILFLPFIFIVRAASSFFQRLSHELLWTSHIGGNPSRSFINYNTFIFIFLMNKKVATCSIVYWEIL